MHWAANYIGRPWSSEDDCWAFVREIFASRFSIELPEAAAGILILSGAAHSTGLRPAHGIGQPDDLVLMRCADGRRHVGVMIEANGKIGVLHNDGRMTEFGPVGCVGFNTLHQLAEVGCKEFTFWRRP